MCVNFNCFIWMLHSSHMQTLQTAHPCSFLSLWAFVVLLNGAALPCRHHYFYQLVWSGLMYQTRAIFMVDFYGSFLECIVIIIFLKKLLLRPYVYSFIIHQVGADHSDVILASMFCVWVSERGASSSHFPFSVSSWYILMNQVVFGNDHIPGYTAQSWHSRRSINICGMDPESSQ